MAGVSWLKWTGKSITWQSVSRSEAPGPVPRGGSMLSISQGWRGNTPVKCLPSQRQAGLLLAGVADLLCLSALHLKYRVLYFVSVTRAVLWVQDNNESRQQRRQCGWCSWTSNLIPVGSHQRIGTRHKCLPEWPWQLNHFHSLWPPRGMFLICQLVVFQVADQTTRSLATFPETVNI